MMINLVKMGLMY